MNEWSYPSNLRYVFTECTGTTSLSSSDIAKITHATFFFSFFLFFRIIHTALQVLRLVIPTSELPERWHQCTLSCSICLNGAKC